LKRNISIVNYYFCFKECGPLEEIGQVIQIKDHSFDVLLVNLGIARRIYCDRLNIVQESVNYVKNTLKPEISFLWEKTEKYQENVKQTLQIFSNVNVVLNKHDSDCMKFNVNF
jgi:DIS3-like exonuclease 2